MAKLPMYRRVRRKRPHFIARRSPVRLQEKLRKSPPDEWSAPLCCAFRILTANYELSTAKAISIISESLSSARGILLTQDRAARLLAETDAQAKIRKACARISNCISRAPSKLRVTLGRSIRACLDDDIIDLEVIKSIFAAVDSVFKQYKPNKTAQTVLKACDEVRITNVSSIGAASQRNVENALAQLRAKMNGHALDSAAVFKAITMAMAPKKITTKKPQGGDAITACVVEFARIWQRNGLQPTRAISTLNAAYRSKFNWFSEFVLLAMWDPRARRLHPKHPNDARGNHSITAIRRRYRPEKNAASKADALETAMKSEDYQWLVGDQHVRRALKI